MRPGDEHTQKKIPNDSWELVNEQGTQKQIFKNTTKQKTLPHAEEHKGVFVFSFCFCQIGTFSKNWPRVFPVQRIFLFDSVEVEIELRILKPKGL